MPIDDRDYIKQHDPRTEARKRAKQNAQESLERAEQNATSALIADVLRDAERIVRKAQDAT